MLYDIPTRMQGATKIKGFAIELFSSVGPASRRELAVEDRAPGRPGNADCRDVPGGASRFGIQQCREAEKPARREPRPLIASFSQFLEVEGLRLQALSFSGFAASFLFPETSIKLHYSPLFRAEDGTNWAQALKLGLMGPRQAEP